jgi:amino acid transporter
MSLQNLFRLDYWFSEPFTARGFTLWLFLGGFLLFVFVGLIFKILSQYQQDKSKRLILKRAGSFGITMGFLGLVWIFFRQERVAFLAWRFWLFLWGAVVVIWAYHLVRYALKRMPEIKAEEAKRTALEKYLPKRN